ncbi:ANTAR domain-containing protein [Nocardioides zeae]|uniref:ANTAR domain-containing protein n=1 Tax=Nocardioides zeae TaxID=1457234 RepID=A0A6P0HPG0_9ACTN|nr:ANTAR domain-containing protein [Nocardioides zeae]NEN80503.1 ANTAR domain-containing protein [Nocardioides zeae]
MDASRSSLAAARAIRALHRPTDLAATLATLVEVARLSLDDVDHVSVSLAGRDGSLETVAATDDLVRDHDRTLGALNLYALETDEIDGESLELAELLAAAAATALGGVRERAHLHTALESRERIGMAVGVVMERFGLDGERAFDYLVRTSQHGNRKLRDVAEALLVPPQEARP